MEDSRCSSWCERVFLSSAAVSEERPALSKRVLLTLAVAQSICVALFHVLLERPSAHTHTHARSEWVTSTPPFHTHWLQSQAHFQTILIHVWVSQCVIPTTSWENEAGLEMWREYKKNTDVYFWSFTKAGWIAMKSGPLLLFNPRPSSERFIISQMREIHWNETTDENQTELRWDQNLVKNHENTSNTFQDSWSQVQNNPKPVTNQNNHIQQNPSLTV